MMYHIVDKTMEWDRFLGPYSPRHGFNLSCVVRQAIKRLAKTFLPHGISGREDKKDKEKLNKYYTRDSVLK